jgi:hypothetical protein
MHGRVSVGLAVVVGLLAVIAPAAADAKRVSTYWQQTAYVAERFWAQLGFIPIAGIQDRGRASVYRDGATTYVVGWNNALVGRSTTDALKQAARYVKYAPVEDGVYTDRFLSTREKRSYQVLADLARDADVLVVHRDNPVCATGLTRAQARGIARGTITRWSRVTTLPDGQPDAIRRRLVGRPGKQGDASAEPRLGAPVTAPHTVVAADGGVGEARVDRRVAAVTSWSRVRRGSGACVVALDGVTPTNATVHGLRYPGAYPIQYVMHRKRSKHGESRVRVREYVRFLKSERAAAMLRNTGVLLAAEPAPVDAVAVPG